MAKLLSYAVWIWLLCQSNVSCAQAGTLDHSFGSGSGYTLIEFPPTISYTNKVLIQPDGKIIAVGHSILSSVYVGGLSQNKTEQTISVARFMSDGSLDPSFGVSGRFQYYTGWHGDYEDKFPSAALQADGKILICNSMLNTDSNYDMLLIRLNANGTPDYSFGDSGKVTAGYGTFDDRAILVNALPNGKILVFGQSDSITVTSTTKHFFFYQFNANGTTDNTFGNAGKVTGSYNGNALAMHVFSTGDIVVNTGGVCLLLDSSGTEYTVPPFQVAHGWGGFNNPNCIAFMDDGGAYAALYNSYAESVLKVQPSGAPDPSFNGTGSCTFSPVPYNSPTGITRQNDGKLLVSSLGYYANTTNTIVASSVVISRLTTFGHLDSSFGMNGSFILDTMTFKGQYPTSMAVQANGKIIVLSDGRTVTSKHGFLLMRLNNDLNTGLENIQMPVSDLSVYPNPALRQIRLNYQTEVADVLSAGIYDVEGRLIQQVMKDVFHQAGEHKKEIELDGQIAKGIYLIKVSGKSYNRVIRLVIK